MPESLALVDRLRADGVPAVISGAGPTVLAFVGARSQPLTDRTPPGWAHHVLDVETRRRRRDGLTRPPC